MKSILQTDPAHPQVLEVLEMVDETKELLFKINRRLEPGTRPHSKVSAALSLLEHINE